MSSVAKTRMFDLILVEICRRIQNLFCFVFCLLKCFIVDLSLSSGSDKKYPKTFYFRSKSNQQLNGISVFYFVSKEGNGL